MGLEIKPHIALYNTEWYKYMDRTFNVVYDAENVFGDKTITSNQLITHFLGIAEGVEDADLIGWLTTLMETDKQEEGVEMICDLLDIQLEGI